MFILTLLAVLFAPTDADISMLGGPTHSGALTSISATTVEISENGKAVQLPIEDVMAVEFPATSPAAAEAPQALYFTDGGQLQGTSIIRTAKSLTAHTALLGDIDAPVDKIHAVRLQAENPTFAQQWSTFLKRESEKDNLVVARRDGTGLDFLAGIVSNVTAESIEFLLDGDKIPVPAERVYGIVFGRQKASKPATNNPNVAIQLTGISGDILKAKTITLDGAELKAESSWGQLLIIPLSQVRKIDLSGGRVQFLSDMPALAERFDGIDPENSLFAGLIELDQQKLLFGPQRDTTIERQSKIRLRGREYAKGLCVHSRTELQWDLEKRFSAMECVVGIDDEVAFNGSHVVGLKITGDGEVLFEKLIATSDAPLPVRLSLEGVSRFTILVDFGDGSSVCDWLDFADARLVIAKEKP